MRPFDEVWKELKQLKGKTVYTLCRKWRNDILRFESNRMWRVAHRGSRQPKPVPKRTFRKMWEHLLIDREFMPKDIPVWKIACACIAHLPEVEYSCKEGFVHLYLRPQNTHPFGEVREYTEWV